MTMEIHTHTNGKSQPDAITPFPFHSYQPRPLEIIDTTLREGPQSSLLHDHFKYFFTTADKEEIARALILYGVKFIELFAPNVSPQEAADFAAVKAVRDDLVMPEGLHLPARACALSSRRHRGCDRRRCRRAEHLHRHIGCSRCETNHGMTHR